MADIFCAVCSEPWDAWGLHHGDMMAWEARLFKAGAGCPHCKGVEPASICAECREPFEDKQGPYLECPCGQKLNPSVREDRSIKAARSMADSWDDPDSFDHVLDTFASAVTGKMPTRKKWVGPEREVVWSCAGCKAQAVRPLAFSLSEPNKGSNAWLEWANGEIVHYRMGFKFARGNESFDTELVHDPDANNGRGGTVRAAVASDEPAVTIAGKTYCDRCARHCDAPSCDNPVFLRSELDPGDPYKPGASHMSVGNVGNYGDTICTECFEEESIDEDDGSENEDCES